MLNTWLISTIHVPVMKSYGENELFIYSTGLFVGKLLKAGGIVSILDKVN